MTVLYIMFRQFEHIRLRNVRGLTVFTSYSRVLQWHGKGWEKESQKEGICEPIMKIQMCQI